MSRDEDSGHLRSAMRRKKNLWLVSWYPNKNDRFNGDFIQRHAKAAAIYQDIHVVFVTDSDIEKQIEEEWSGATGLTEQIIYFKKKKGITARALKQLTWRKLYQKAIKNYIEKNGLPDCIHVHVPWKAGLIALWMKRKYGRNFMITEHWGIYNEVVEDNFYTKPKLNRALLKNLFKEAKALVSVSDFLGKGVERISGKKTDMIIPNVVDTALFFYKQEKYSKFTFIHVSNMVPLKNVKAILDAFKTMSQATGKDVQLILIGNRNNEYPEYADKLGLLDSSVFFKGEISYAEVAKEMQHSHCFVLNSNMENSPCVISEALCCGLPVIATNVGGVVELINNNNNNGYLISSGDNEALVSAMEDICNNYSVFNQKQISEEAIQKFSYSSIAKKFDELYRKFC